MLSTYINSKSTFDSSNESYLKPVLILFCLNILGILVSVITYGTDNNYSPSAAFGLLLLSSGISLIFKIFFKQINLPFLLLLSFLFTLFIISIYWGLDYPLNFALVGLIILLANQVINKKILILLIGLNLFLFWIISDYSDSEYQAVNYAWKNQHFTHQEIFLFLGYLIVMPLTLSKQNHNHKISPQNNLSNMDLSALSLIHEINSPLTVVNMNLDTLKANNFKLSDALEYTLYKQAIESSDKALCLIEKIISSARLQTQNQYKPNKFDVTQTINLVIAHQKYKLDKYKITVKLDTKSSTPAFTYEASLYQVISNLIGNSIDATKTIKNPQIKISLRSNQNQFILTVKDNGTGIKSADAKRIYSLYFSTKKSSGIGLYLSKQLVNNLLQGKLTHQSKINHGTTAKLVFSKKVS